MLVVDGNKLLHLEGNTPFEKPTDITCVWKAQILYWGCKAFP